MPTSPAPAAPPRRAAYCDMDGTLCRTDIVGPLIYLRRRLTRFPARELWVASLLFRGPWWLLLDKFSRASSNRAIYACYAGLGDAAVRELAAACHREYLYPRLFPAALARLRELRAQGVQLVLVTGSIDFLVAPLAAELGAQLLAPRLETEAAAAGPGGECPGGAGAAGRVFSGRLADGPLTGEGKAAAVRRHAAEQQVDLAASFAFGDALGDLPMLECVGHPVVVNPGRRLAAVAAARGWPVEQWRIAE